MLLYDASARRQGRHSLLPRPTSPLDARPHHGAAPAVCTPSTGTPFDLDNTRHDTRPRRGAYARCGPTSPDGYVRVRGGSVSPEYALAHGEPGRRISSMGMGRRIDTRGLGGSIKSDFVRANGQAPMAEAEEELVYAYARLPLSLAPPTTTTATPRPRPPTHGTGPATDAR
ncbi:hypothetical protein B0H13DRAFT_2134608 [Mycena leptocephala]|nr:hypothetical protein B0H13DRAFT_2134608 [Mycena leptocephala]